MTRRSFDRSWAQNHPRILWSPRDLPALRAKLDQPALARVRSAVLDACARYADPADPLYINPALGRADLIGDGIWGGTLYPKLDKLLVGCLLAGKQEWIDKLTAVIRVLTTDPQLSRAYILGKHEALDLFGVTERPLVAAQSGLLPLAFDAIHDLLPADVRDAARAYLRDRVAEPFKRYLLADGRLRRLSLGINLAWWDFQSGILSLAAVFDPDRPDDLDALAMAGDAVRRGLHMGVDENGYIGEGPFYGSIDMAAWLATVEVLARAGVADLWADEPVIRRMMRARFHLAMPDPSEVLPVGDASRAVTLYLQAQPLLLAARRLGEPGLQTLWESVAGETVPAPSALAPMGVLAPWLWLDPAPAPAAASAPAPASLPLALGGGRWGVNVMRSGWGREDLLFSLFAAGRDPGTYIHQHVDAGSFSLAALGEVFCTGRGYGHTQPQFHSLMLPGGVEPADTPGCVGQMWRGGRTLDFAPGRAADYVRIDIAAQWLSQWFHRHALVVRHPGSAGGLDAAPADSADRVEPYVILLDNCNQKSDWLPCDWTMQIEPGHQATLDQGARRASVQGRQHRLELAWAIPRPEDYSTRPHYLELLTDHTPVPQRPDLDGTGGKGYPRLVARLHGYNGMLLSALLPRRQGQPAAGITQLAGFLQFGLKIDHGPCIDTIVYSPIDRHLNLAGIEGEATLALVRQDRQGRVRYAAAADAYALSVNGTQLCPRQGDRAALAEWIEG